MSCVGGERASYVGVRAVRARGTLRAFALVLTAASLAACAQPSVVATGAQGETHGLASFYRNQTRTASGERASPGELTAAHRTLPLPTKVSVTNLENNRSVIVIVNDRGPFTGSRLIDLSQGAAQQIGMRKQGTARVKVVAIDSDVAAR